MSFAVQNSISLLNAPLFPLGKLFSPQLAFFPTENHPPSHLPQSQLPETLHLPCGPDSKESACSVGDWGSIPGSGRSLEEGNGNPLHYSCLENFLDRGAWWAQSSPAQFSSVAQSCLTLQPHGLQHARLPCPSPTPGLQSMGSQRVRHNWGTNSFAFILYILKVPAAARKPESAQPVLLLHSPSEVRLRVSHLQACSSNLSLTFWNANFLRTPPSV